MLYFSVIVLGNFLNNISIFFLHEKTNEIDTLKKKVSQKQKGKFCDTFEKVSKYLFQNRFFLYFKIKVLLILFLIILIYIIFIFII